MRAYLCLLLLSAASAFAAPSADYSRDIRPILSANCLACHGPDEHSRKAKLRLDTFEGATAARDGVQAVVPGKPEKSELISRITTTDSDDVMPPTKTGNKLTPEHINLLRSWILSGAQYAEHWSFTPVVQPALPVVKDRKWARNAVDHFILAKLEAAGLKPQEEADRRALIRRLALDLIGLPPTPDEVKAFLEDNSPDAYEKVVDRLLASDRFGEHWARMWLDLARYADTKGYEKDQARSMWRYRDWVIEAFNRDMPYDRFTTAQLAGDLLPNPTQDDILATAFHRNTMTNDEGGTDDEEFRSIAVKDRVDTTAQVWMGLTMGCAKCHTHKYDPISHAEYYQFYAFFNQTADADRGDEAPTTPMPTREQAREKSDLEVKVKTLESEFWKEIPGFKEKQDEWEKQIARGSLWAPLEIASASSTGGSVLEIEDKGKIKVSGPHPEAETNIVEAAPISGSITAFRLEALENSGSKGPGRNSGDPNVVISEFSVEWVKADGSSDPLKLANARSDFSQDNWTAPQAIDGDPEKGWAFAPKTDDEHLILFDLQEPRVFAEGKLRFTIVQQYPKLQLGRFRLSASVAESSALRPEFLTAAELAAIAPAQRSTEQSKRLDQMFRESHEPTAAVHQELVETKRGLDKLNKSIALTPIMKELAADKQRATKIHLRGNFLEPGEAVFAGVPAAFARLPEGSPANRLGVAVWLTDKSNPLAARVAANRAWARLFGVGLVETEEDFGAQGTLPSHPELLDWLAAEFRDSLHWSWKGLLRTIVLSSTYRQDSNQEAAKLAQDSANRLLSRSPRYRLPAEVVRDQALAAAGLLSPKIGGPSVMPPQPEGIWRAVYSGLVWKTSEGEDRHRRGLYTFCRRTSPYPSMMTFDAGSGEICLVRRIRTNTPLQALVTLNDPVYLEAAGALGRSMADEKDAAAGLRLGYERVLGRPPESKEISRMQKLLSETRAEYENDPQATKEFLESANLKLPNDVGAANVAAWTVIGNVLLNLDETLTRP